MSILHNHFASSALYREQPESMKHFLRKRWSFWLALFSCVAFLMGNMVGQHGWQAFWKSVWGKEGGQIIFTGTVSPLPYVPDSGRWSPVSNHTYDFDDVPEELLVVLPAYTPLSGCDRGSNNRSVLSVDYNGDYSSGGVGCGSHPAADILTPKGTPVVSVMNGIVDRMEKRSWGFGNTVVIRHPNVPDPDHPIKTTTLYSSYAHLGNIFVGVGDVVQKGEQIAVSGQTGLATAPHLHFQIDREAPFHPYWPFTTSEATEAGFSFMEAVNAGLGQERAKQYTVNPLSYVQDYRGSQDILIARKGSYVEENYGEAVVKVETSTESIKDRVLAKVRSLLWARRDARKAKRLARLEEREQRSSALALKGNVKEVVLENSENSEEVKNDSSSESPDLSEFSVSSIISNLDALDEDLQPLVIVEESGEEIVIDPISTVENGIPMPPGKNGITSITILHDGEFNGGWEEIVLFARDENGQFLRHVRFEGDIELITVFGDASFAPSKITEEQFDDRGRAIVKMLPRSGARRAIVPAIGGVFSARGEPMAFNPSERVFDEYIASEEVSLRSEEE